MSATDLSALVVDVATAPPGGLLAAVERHLAAEPWFGGARILVADYGDRTLVDPFTAKAGDGAIPADEGALGRAYRGCAVVLPGEDDLGGVPGTVLVPLRLRSDCVGVLEVRTTASPSEDDVRVLQAVGHVLGQVLWAGKHDHDVVERARRVQPMALSAEIQWDLLSARVESGPGYSAAGWLEPAYSVGGDSFDIAVDVDTLWVSSIDAMGHGLHAGITSGLALTAIRNVRRQGGDVAAQAAAVNDALGRVWGGEHFATLLLLRLDLATGEVQALNAGHPPARHQRGGTVAERRLAVDLPAGVARHATYRVQRFGLEPGDRVVITSDGVAEAAMVGGPGYGVDRIDADLAGWRQLSPLELARSLAWSVLRHADERLRDDATIVCFDWEPPP